MVVVAAAAYGFLTAGPGGSAGPPVISTPRDRQVFLPATVTAPSTGTVRLLYRNESSVSHNLTFLDPLSVATRTILEPGTEELLEFPAPPSGSYRFRCTIHPGMEGTLTVQ